MLSVLTIACFVIAAVLLFSLAVFIHEAGHFVVARLLGMRADVFSIGFGPAIWKRKIGETEYRVSAIPFGGYVSLPQLDPEGMKRIQGGTEITLPPAPPWKRILVAVAGPMGNIVLAVLCAAAISWLSPPEATGSSTEIGLVEEGSSANLAGLERGDRIVAVNGTAVRTWEDYLTECYLSGTEGDTVTLTVEREGETVTAKPILDESIGEGFFTVGGIVRGPLLICIGKVSEGSPASEAGIQPGEIVTAVDGKRMEDVEQLTNRDNPAQDVTLTLTAPDGSERTVTLTPRVLPGSEDTVPRLGVILAHAYNRNFQWMAERGIGAQLWADASGIFRVLEALTAPKAEGETARAARGLGGPLMIFTLFFQVVQAGLWASLGFVRLICVNLAILNLLPIPVLDGGHILFALFAMIFRREISPRVVAWVTNVFAFALIALMLLLVYRDTLRFF